MLLPGVGKEVLYFLEGYLWDSEEKKRGDC